MKRLLLLWVLPLACEGSSTGQAPSDAGASHEGDAFSSRPVVLATGQPSPWTIAVDNENVYWVNADPARGGVQKVAKNGGAPVALYSGPMLEVESVALDATSLYFPVVDAIAAVPLSGGPMRKLAPASAPRAVAVARGEVYWFEEAVSPGPREDAGAPRVAKKVSVQGGTPIVIQLPADLALAPQRAYQMVTASDGVYTSLPPGGGIVKIPFEGVPTLVYAGEARGIAPADRLYLTNGAGLHAVTETGESSTLLPTASGSLLGVAADTGSLYVAEAGPAGRILRVDASDGVQSIMAVDQATPHAVAVDATHVYWNCIDDGTIRKMPK